MALKITAKPIKWQESLTSEGYLEAFDEVYGFAISEDGVEPDETRFYAAWGEGEGENFATAKAAKDWCQGTIDNFMAERAVVTET